MAPIIRKWYTRHAIAFDKVSVSTADGRWHHLPEAAYSVASALKRRAIGEKCAVVKV